MGNALKEKEFSKAVIGKIEAIGCENMTVQPNQLAKIFKALGDENRLRILEMLQGEERCACMLLDEMHITQPTLSHHMKILCDVDLVIGRKEGKWMHYRLNADQFQKVAQFLQRTAEMAKNDVIFVSKK